MFCKDCGKQVNVNASVCLSCGSAVVKGWSDNTFHALMIGTILIPLIGLIAGVVGLLTGNTNRGCILLVTGLCSWFVSMIIIGMLFSL